MSFKTCEWFNKEKKKLSSKIQYFDVIKENYDTKFFNDIIHYKSKHKELPDKIKFTKLKLTNYDKKLKNLIKKKSEMIENNTIIKESTKKANLTKIIKEINNHNKVITHIL
jgi:hypothetical protein